MAPVDPQLDIQFRNFSSIPLRFTLAHDKAESGVQPVDFSLTANEHKAVPPSESLKSWQDVVATLQPTSLDPEPFKIAFGQEVGMQRIVCVKKIIRDKGLRVLAYLQVKDYKKLIVSIYLSPLTQNWMSQLPDQTNLARVYLPGTHESMSMHGFPFSSCQSKTIRQQLDDGVRFLDVRLRLTEEGTLLGYHGIQNQYITAEEIITQLYAFLDANPSEAVVVSLKQENAAQDFEGVLWRLLDQQKNKWFSEDRWPTLNEVRGKALCFCRFGFSSKRGIHTYTWPNNSQYPFECITGGIRTIIQDWYGIGSFLSIPAKTSTVLSLFKSPSAPPAQIAASNYNFDDPNAPAPTPSSFSSQAASGPAVRINFASAAALITAFPYVVATGIGFPNFLGLGMLGVNERILDELLNYGREATKGDSMVLLLDYYETPGNLIDLLIAWNFEL